MCERVGRVPVIGAIHSHCWGGDRSGQPILVVVANIHTQILKVEVEEGSLTTALAQGLVGNSKRHAKAHLSVGYGMSALRNPVLRRGGWATDFQTEGLEDT
jgi:hypothetical protein